MGITDGNILLCHGISEESEDKKNSLREYNNRTVYDYLNIPFTDYFDIPYLNLPYIIIDDSTRLDKRACYTPDLLPAAISVASKNSVSTLTTPSDPPQVIVLNSDDTNTHH